MSLKKTASQEAPHAIFTMERAGWEWRVLKTYKKASSEARDQYARWFVFASSPMCPHGEMGDTYVRDIVHGGSRLIACTQEFADEYPDLVEVFQPEIREAA